MAYQPQQGVFDQGYMDFLSGLSQPDVANRAKDRDQMVRGTATDYATLQAIKGALGRNPTAAEFAAYAPLGAQASQLIAQQNLADQNTPDTIAAKNNAKYLADAPNHADAVNNLFQSNFGRTASKDELDHFGSLLASGTTDPYQLQQFLKQQPEYQNTQNAKMRTDLSGTMAANDKRQFSEQILPSIQAAYAKQGRSFDSSAFQAAAANAAQAQNTNREGFLNNLTASQYGGVQDRAYQDYANQVANQQALTNSGINAKYSNVQNSIGRANEINNFGLQQQAYNQYLNKYGKRQNNGVMGAISGAGTGAAAGSAFGPWGTGIGAVVGGLGGYFGSQGSY